MKLKNKPKINLEHSSTIFALMFVAMVMVVASILLSKQLFSSIRFTGRVIAKHNETRDTLAQNVQTLPELKSNYELLSTEGPEPDKVLRALPTDDNFPGLATLIEQLAAVSNVRLTAISVVESGPTAQATIVTDAPTDVASAANATDDPAADPAAQGTPIVMAQPETVSFNISVNGEYTDILEFFNAIETAIRPMTVSAVSLGGTNNAITAELSLLTYFQTAALFEPGEEVVR